MKRKRLLEGLAVWHEGGDVVNENYVEVDRRLRLGEEEVLYRRIKCTYRPET